jgi:demethylmenaquinone methyltransferase/2-methoxy-6-polyprenyl-1,4-benzoquinol methylase
MEKRGNMMRDQKEYFNSVAEVWDKHAHNDEKKIGRILDLIHIREGSRILDVGTGTGVLIPYLSERTGSLGSVTGIDQAEKMIMRAKEKFGMENVSFITGNVFELLPEENAFDYITCYNVFPHFEDQEESVRYLAGLLKSGGSLLIFHSGSRDKINRMHRNKSPEVRDALLPAMEVMKDYLEDAGLTVVLTADNEEMFAIAGRKEEIQ